MQIYKVTNRRLGRFVPFKIKRNAEWFLNNAKYLNITDELNIIKLEITPEESNDYQFRDTFVVSEKVTQ